MMDLRYERRKLQGNIEKTMAKMPNRGSALLTNPSKLTYVAVLVLLSLALPFTAVAQTGKGSSVTLTFDKAFSPSTIGSGSVSTLQFDIVNPFSNPRENLAFTDNLPAGMTIATPANTSSTCLGTLSAPDGGATISLSGGGVGGPSSCSISVDVTATACQGRREIRPLRRSKTRPVGGVVAVFVGTAGTEPEGAL